MEDLIQNPSPTAPLGLPGMGPLLDACSLESIGLTFQSKMDASSFFLSEVDVDECPRNVMPAVQSSTDLLAQLNSEEENMIGDVGLLGTSAPGNLGSSWMDFPSIPEHAELNLSSADPVLKDTYIEHEYSATSAPNMNENGARSSGASPTNSDSLTPEMGNELGSDQYGTKGWPSFVPRVSSMPNLHLGTMHGQIMHKQLQIQSALNDKTYSLRKFATSNSSEAISSRSDQNMPRSRSASELQDLSRYVIPHAEFLTPPHLRKGKGGRQPASDPRLDPRIDPRKAKRILANRLSAAKSKLKQKSANQGLRQRVEMLRLQRDSLTEEVSKLEEACTEKEIQQIELKKCIVNIEKSTSTS